MRKKDKSHDSERQYLMGAFWAVVELSGRALASSIQLFLGWAC